MNEKFLKWLESKKDELEKSGVTIDNINITNQNVPNPSITVDHFSQICLGRISVWETGEMDIEVLHFESEKRLLFEHYELQENADFSKILVNYFKILTNGNDI